MPAGDAGGAGWVPDWMLGFAQTIGLYSSPPMDGEEGMIPITIRREFDEMRLFHRPICAGRSDGH